MRTSILSSAIFCAATTAVLAQAPPSGGTPPGGGSSSASVTYYATYKLDGGTATQTNQTYSAAAADTSAVWVANSGVLALVNTTITTSGNTSSQDNSSFYGLNAGLLVTSGSATMTNGSITTTGTGANGAFATGSGAGLSLTNVTINASADGGHAIMATQGAKITAVNLTMNTSGGSSSAIATDRGGGTIQVTNGNVVTSGSNSAGIYSTGEINVTGTTFKSTGAEGAVIEGANSISLTDVSMTVTKEKWGVMIYQSMSGDASGTRGVFTMTGGSFNYQPAAGPLFYVNNTTGIITLKNVAITANSGVLVSAAAGSWGVSGSNGGTVTLSADTQTLNGNMTADSISSISALLKNNSTLKGKLTNVALSLDATSTWTVTANSTLTSLTDSAGVSGSAITNILGNGFTVTYDASLTANSYLGGKTYSLAGGGTLAPAGTSTAVPAPSINAGGIGNTASGVAGIAPGAWISIYGTNLATATALVGSSDLVNGYLPATFGGTSVTVNDKAAYVDFVSPGQINVLAPDDTATGTVTVKVTTSGGTASTTSSLQSVLPGLFVDSNYVLAVRPSDAAVIGASVPAKPGDTLELFATGLGATTPAVATGLVFSGAYATNVTPVVTIGGTKADVLYSGLIGPGLYQVNVTLPATLAAGTYPVVLSMNGANSPDTARMVVAAK